MRAERGTLRPRLAGRKGFLRPMRILRVGRTAFDRFFMRKAMRLAQQAARKGEVPVGAVLVSRGIVLACAGNRVEQEQDGTAHAELLVLRAASRVLGRRLTAATLYVSLEPCVMCAGALLHARLGRLVFGARDPERGGCGSQLDVLGQAKNLHHVSVTSGIFETEIRSMLQDFFRARRTSKGGKA